MNGNPPPVVCFGELLLRLSSPRGEALLKGSRLDAHFGGAEGNVAVALARLGRRSAMISAVPGAYKPVSDRRCGNSDTAASSTGSHLR